MSGRVICACRPGQPLPGCPQHNPSLVIHLGKLVAQHPAPPAAPWVGRDTSESGVFDYCKVCREGVRTMWPATIAQLEANRHEFVEGHSCPGAATP